MNRVQDGVEPQLSVVGLLRRTVAEFLDGSALAGQHLSDLRARLDAHGSRVVGARVAAIEVMLHIRAGRLALAEARVRGQVGPDVPVAATGPAWWCGAQLTAIRWYQGRIGELAPNLVAAVVAAPPHKVEHSWLAAAAVVAAAAGDERVARDMVARLRERGLAGLSRTPTGLVGLYGAVESAYLLGDRETAVEAYDPLLSYVDRPLMVDLAATCFGSVQHALGVAALAMGKPELAVAHLSAAVSSNLRLGHKPAAVVARIRLAHALELRAHPGDADKAARERQIARSDASALAMPQPDQAWPAANPHGWSRRPSPPATCRRRGRRWEIMIGGRTALVEPSRGMQYLAILIANPGQEVPAVELAAGVDFQLGTAPLEYATAQPLLDDVAQRQYRTRLRALQADIEASERSGDPGRADDLRTERNWLIAELSTAAGFGGRTRTFTGNGERARVAVTRAIRRAVEYVSTADPVVGRALSGAVQTGRRCSYQPY